ncbi:uncharacterized protein METZ01_LOCUS245545, partial [marine metagenome]
MIILFDVFGKAFYDPLVRIFLPSAVNGIPPINNSEDDNDDQ